MGPLYHMGWWTPIVHLGTLAAFLTLGALAWKFGRDLRWAKVAIALATAFLWLVLTIYDANNLVYARFGLEPMSLGNLTVFYCSSKSLFVCLAGFPSVILFVIGPLLVITMMVAALIYSRLGAIADIAGQALRDAGCCLPPVIRRNAGRFLFVVCGIYVSAWIIAPKFMLAREPAASIIYVPPFEHGPLELVDLPRPTYRVVPTTGVVPRPLILITVDSLRRDAVGLAPGKPTLTPFLRSLALGGKLHDMGPAIAACSASYCGIAAIQSSGSWATLQNGPPLALSDVLFANAFQTHFLLTGLHESTANLRELYGPRVTSFLSDNSADSAMRFDDREQVRRLRDLKIKDPDRTFIAIHLMSSHAAGARFDTKPHPGEDPAVDPAEVSRYHAFYEGGVRQADRMIGEIFAVLAAKGILDRAAVIITADHGEMVESTGKISHGGDPARSTAAIPMLVYDGQGASWPSHPLVSQADAAATLIGLVGVGRPAAWQGQNLKFPTIRRAVPTDSRHVAGMVALVGGRRLMFTCRIETGEMKVEALDGTPLTAAERGHARGTAPQLYRTLPRRKDAQRCFR